METTSSCASASTQHSITHEMHSRLEMYANRLAEVEQQQAALTDIDDEHHLIAQYRQSLTGDTSQLALKSPMQIMLAIDVHQKTELETIVKDLEEQNKTLQAEYDRLQTQKKISDNENQVMSQEQEFINCDAEMIAEAKLLRQHKDRLEARMRILEDHNQQLEAQLQKIRQLLQQSCDRRLSSSMYENSLLTTSSSSDCSSPSCSKYFMLEMEPTTQINGHQTDEGTDNVWELFNMAGQVGEAIGCLVTVMTEDDDDIIVEENTKN